MRKPSEGWWAVQGTPVDSVILGMTELLDETPQLCLSGINHGPNMGEDVLYSGTVSAAMEATVNGINAVAFSYADRKGKTPEVVDEWQGSVTKLLQGITVRDDFPKGTLLKVNLPPIPPAEVRGVRVTSVGRRRYENALHRRKDPMGREFFWLGGGDVSWDDVPDCDFRAVEEGYISLSPVHLQLTHHEIIEEIQGWDLTL